MTTKCCEFKDTCTEYKLNHVLCEELQNACSTYPYLKAGYKQPIFKYHGDEPKLFEYDEGNKIVDVFTYKDPRCPYPYSITNTRNDSDIWTHQGFYVTDFIERLKGFLSENNLPFTIQKKEKKK